MNQQIKESELTDLLDEPDPPYESREELKIGRMLDQYGIPFFYKQPTVILNRNSNEIWYPGFTLPHYGGIIIDYIEQQRQAAERINIYRYNQTPVTILGPKDLDKSNWQELLYGKLEQSYRRLIEEPNYAMPCNHE